VRNSLIIFVVVLLVLFSSGCVDSEQPVTPRPISPVPTVTVIPLVLTSAPVTTLPHETTNTPVITTIHPTTVLSTEPPTQNRQQQKETNYELEECKDQKFTVAPIEFDELRQIAPLGSINPPGHTIPTEHTYLDIDQEYGGQKMVLLKSPGDIYITAISSADDQLDPTRKEYVIDFSLCKDLHGYYNHVKELSDELKEVLSNVECEKWDHNPGNSCQKNLFYTVKAGTVLGEVGHTQGNFDFGAYDYRIKHEFINPSRYGFYEEDSLGPKTLYKVCPYDYYNLGLKEELYAKLQNNGEPKCGKVMQDLRGTLQGNWFYGGASWSDPLTWKYGLAFVYEHADPTLSTISVAGYFTDSGKWRFTEETVGSMNRKFSDVTPDGNIYCYEGIDPYISIDPARTDFKHDGKIILELISDDELKIEHQSGICSGDEAFASPAIYNR